MILPLLLVLLTQTDSKPAVAPVAAAAPRPQVVLKVGEQTISPIKVAVTVRCADRSVVEPLKIDGRYELKGLAPGTTTCKFSQADQPVAKIVEVTVTK